MTILKQILLAGAFLIGIQPIAHAYNIAEFKRETAQILDLIEDLRYYGTPEATEVADQIQTDLDSRNLSDMDVIAIAKIFTSSESINEKISNLHKKFINDALKQAKKEREWTNVKSIILPLLGATAALWAVAWYNDISACISYKIWEHDNSLLSKVQEMTATTSKADKESFSHEIRQLGRDLEATDRLIYNIQDNLMRIIGQQDQRIAEVDANIAKISNKETSI